MRVNLKAIIIGTLRRLPKVLERSFAELEIGGQIDTNQTTELLKLLEYCEESERVEVTCSQSDSSEIPPTKAGVKN